MAKVTYNKGKYKVAIVGSCPGRHEASEGKYFAKATGTNLNIALDLLNNHNSTLFPSTDRYDYTLSNSVETVYYNALNGRTVPPALEVIDPANIKRLYSEIKDCDVIILTGDEAKLAWSELCKVYSHEFPGDRMIAKTIHFSPTRINTCIKASGADGHTRNINRIRQITDSIIEQLDI